MTDLLTVRAYWPYLPHVDLDLMEIHHPGAKKLINFLKLTLHEKWNMPDGWTGLYKSDRAHQILERATTGIEDHELVQFCTGIVEDLFLWAMNN